MVLYKILRLSFFGAYQVSHLRLPVTVSLLTVRRSNMISTERVSGFGSKELKLQPEASHAVDRGQSCRDCASLGSFKVVLHCPKLEIMFQAK